MAKPISPLELAHQNIEYGKGIGVAQLYTEDVSQDGRTILSKGKEMLNFGNCSYLGLELDQRLKDAAVDAVGKFGTQFSCSRSYVSLGMYEELESLLEEIFGNPVIVAPSTTMAHFSAIPCLISPKDAVIIDQQVHSSIQSAVKLVQANGTRIERSRHNHMEMLERKIKRLTETHEKVWYMADGIYSMYGDLCPLDKIQEFLDKYPNLYFYIDDAHGVGWTGKKGRGYVLENMDFHPRMVFTGSMAKSFGSCGGILVLPNIEMKKLVRNTGGTLMFSGPLQPATLAACIASVKIHLNGNIDELQADLMERLVHFRNTANVLGLPLANQELTPIFYIAAGTVKSGIDMCKNMMDKGFYTNIAAFPSVPYENTGLRITITRHHSLTDITALLNTAAKVLPDTLKAWDWPMSKVFDAFNLPKSILVPA